MNRSKSKTLCNFWIFSLAVLVPFVQGCATTKPTPVDPLAYKDRTKSSINEDVTVTVAVPTIAEAQAICGVELTAKHIQPVWLEVENDSADTYWFLPSGLVYSQALASHGYVKGVGVVTEEAPRMNLVGDPFYTDGFRAVLFFEPRPYSLSDIEFLKWETPSGYFKNT